MHSGEEGLRSVQYLLREIDALPPGGKNKARLLSDLRQCERILIAAARQGLRWRFEVASEHDPES